MPTILTVGELTRAVKDVLETEFPILWVRGQVANVSRPASGHVYFSLTDGESVLSVVWFKSAQWSVNAEGQAVNPATGEVLENGAAGPVLEEGREVLCAGRLNVYERRGVYQLVAEMVQEEGVGDLHMAFEALKRDLAARGWFDASRKRALPRHPLRVALITSPRGAAVRDFLRLANERGHGVEIHIYPCLVQGDKAPAEIAGALTQAGTDGWAELTVLVRGGGSLEDLWAFNAEDVARAIVESPIPVVTGVGHEPDVTIADYVADRRAATPSHAAELLWPRRSTLAQELDGLEMRLRRAYAEFLLGRQARFAELRRALVWLSPLRRLERLAEGFADRGARLALAGERYFQRGSELLENRTRRLGRAFGPWQLEEREAGLGQLARRLERAAVAQTERRDQGIQTLFSRLTALDPEKPLERGYSLVRLRSTGAFLRSISEVEPGDALDIRTRDGMVEAEVLAAGPQENEKEKASRRAARRKEEKR
ncbi:MAG: exodeoxyribonuclease VII large subunit [Desulfovibrionaceae bacterium]